MEDNGLTRLEISNKAQLSYDALNKSLTRPGTKPTLEQVAALERAYELQLGTFLRRAGFVEDKALPEDLVRTDRRFSNRWRNTILDMIQTATALGPDDSKRS